MPAIRIAVGSVLFLLLSGWSLAAPAGPRVVFDQAHGQRFLVDRGGDLDLSELAGVLADSGLSVMAAREPISARSLDGAAALVIAGAFSPLTPAELDAVTAFLEGGGRLAVMLHVAPPLKDLLSRLRLSYSNGVIREEGAVIGGEPLDFLVTRLEPHPLWAGIDRFAVFGAWALLATGGDTTVIAATGPGAWVDLNRNQRLDGADGVGSFGVAAAGAIGAGRFVVFGDDAIFQNRFLLQYNRSLAAALAGWLAGGSR